MNGLTPACWCYLVAAVPIQRLVGLQEKEKRTVVYIPEMQEAELMYLLFDLVTDNLEEVVSFFK